VVNEVVEVDFPLFPEVPAYNGLEIEYSGSMEFPGENSALGVGGYEGPFNASIDASRTLSPSS
jgi:hypothetical protein